MRESRQSSLRARLLAVGPLLLGCTLVDEPIVVQDCTTEGQKQFVNALMHEHYLWYDRIPQVDLDEYSSPEQLLDALAYRELDRWTSMEPAAPRAAFFEEGKYVGVGYLLVFDQDNAVRIGLSYADSPAGRAGLERGSKILSINGHTIEEIVTYQLWDTIEGDREVGVSIQLSVEHLDGSQEDLVLEKDWVRMDTVHTTRTLDSAVGKVGYLLFTSFLSTSVEQLRQAFADLESQQVMELVLDLRYNGGGLVSTSQVLASLIGGAALDGEIFVRPTHNDRHPERDSVVRLAVEQHDLQLDGLTVLTGPATASASELLINGLRPFVNVELIGEQTYGKPVGAETWVYCEKAISPITFVSLNADGEADYFDGFAPRCPAPDDLRRPLGDPEEARLSVALDWLRDEVCPDSTDEGDATSDAGPGLHPQSARALLEPIRGGRPVTQDEHRPWGLF
jgi:carboxyl-terminal processing protease